jgi:hypothetical protein
MSKLQTDGTLKLGIDDNVAKNLVQSRVLPPKSTVSAAYTLWNLVATITFIGAIVCSFIYDWWYFIPGFFLATLIASQNRKGNAQNIVLLGTRDQHFYNQVKSKGLWIYAIKTDLDISEFRHD